MEIKIVKEVLSANDAVAKEVTAMLTKQGIYCVNLMGSPGSGKTTLLEKTMERLLQDYRIGVIEGDIATTLDAEKLSRFPIKVTQVNTLRFGGECHLEASWIRDAVLDMEPEDLDFIFIENIGNLVCPAEFMTGAHVNILVLSVPEGEDKPLKYPLAFQVSELALLSKVDLTEILDYDTAKVEENIKKVHPDMDILQISSKEGSGIDAWVKWLKARKDALSQ